MPGNWPVPFGKGPSEKDPRHGNLVGGLLHSKRRELETEHPVMVTAVKRPAGETRGKVAAGPKAGQMPPRQLPTLQQG